MMPRWVHHDLQGRESTFLSGRGEATDLRPDVPLDNHHLATMMMKLTVMIMLVKISLSSEDLVRFPDCHECQSGERTP